VKSPKNKLDKRIKVSAEDVLSQINGKHKKKRDLAKDFEVTDRTISNKIRTLQEVGHPIIFSKKGLICIDKEWLESEPHAEELEDFLNWCIGGIKRFHSLISPTQPLLPEMKRTLSVNYSPEERRELARDCFKAGAFLTFIEEVEEAGKQPLGLPLKRSRTS